MSGRVRRLRCAVIIRARATHVTGHHAVDGGGQSARSPDRRSHSSISTLIIRLEPEPLSVSGREDLSHAVGLEFGDLRGNDDAAAAADRP